MKSTKRQKFPPGWNAKKVRAVIAFYDQQTEDEGAMEIETAPEAPEELMSVPSELVPIVSRLIDEHRGSAAKARRNPVRNGKAHRQRGASRRRK
jgi:hypothetical protein